jgi:hypothetical protein
MVTKGASQTDPFGPSLDQYGVLKEVGVSDKYIDLAQAIAGKPREFDPALASFLYFSKMGELASQPGATLFGSVAGAASSPAEYLMKLDEENRKIQATVPATAINLMKALKPSGAGTTTLNSYKLQKDIPGIGSKGDIVTLTNANAAKITGEDPAALLEYTAPTSGSEDKTRMDVIMIGAEDNPATKDIDERVANIKRSEFDPSKHLPMSALDTSDSTDGPSSIIAKLYKDLKNATPGTDEYKAIEKQIEAEVKKTGFAEKIFSAEKDLRNEWEKVSVPFQKVEGNHKKLKEALGKQTGVGDMSAIFMYMKMLDPGSVVRESEFSAAQSTAGAMQQVIVLGKQLMKGDKLAPEQRQAFLDLAEVFYKVAKGYTDQKRKNLQFNLENNPTLTFSNVFGKEYPPPSFYLNSDNIKKVRDSGLTMQEIWSAMTDKEKRNYK